MVILDSETAIILKSVFVVWIRCSKSSMFFESECSDEREKEREFLLVNYFGVCSWSIS